MWANYLELKTISEYFSLNQSSYLLRRSSLKCQRGDCQKPALKGENYCKEHRNPYDGAHGLRYHEIRSSGLTFNEFRLKFLDHPDMGESALLIADDALLDYEYYSIEKRLMKNPHFTPQLSGPHGGDYKQQHQQLEVWFLDHFFLLLDQRLRLLDSELRNYTPLVRDDFFLFRDRLNRVNDAVESKNLVMGIPEFDPLKILLKKLLRKRDYDPQLLDAITKAFDPGSAIFYLALFEHLQNFEILANLEEDLINLAPGESFEIIRKPVVILKPWPHQNTAFEAWSTRGKMGIVEMATATGKTLVGLIAIEDLAKDAARTHHHVTVRVIANTQILLNQWRREVVKKLGLLENVNYDYTYPVRLEDLDIFFNTTQSVQKSPEEYSADLLIADEVHNMTGPEYKKALSIDCSRKLGLSATIEGEIRKAVLDEGLGPIVDSFTLADAMNAGIIPAFDWKVIPVYLAIEEGITFDQLSTGIRNKFNFLRQDFSTIEKLKKERTPLKDIAEFVKLTERARSRKIDLPDEWKQLQGMIIKRRWIIHKSQPRIEHAIKLAESLTNHHKIIMFAMDIKSCDLIGKELGKSCGNVFVLHSDIPEKVRNDRIRKFDQCKGGILIGAQMLSEGLNFPDADIGINVAASKTRLQLTQRMGRILRKGDSGTKHPVFYHFVAIPERDSYIPEEDDLAFLDDLAWVQDTALRMGLDADIIWDEELLKDNVERETVSWFHDKFFKKDLASITKVGTYNVKYVVNQFSESATYRIISILKALPPQMELTDTQWTRIIRLSADYNEKNKFLNFPGYWWLLVLAKRKPGNLIGLFYQLHDEPHYSPVRLDAVVVQKAITELLQSTLEEPDDVSEDFNIPDSETSIEEKNIYGITINNDLSDLFEDEMPSWLKGKNLSKLTVEDFFEPE